MQTEVIFATLRQIEAALTARELSDPRARLELSTGWTPVQATVSYWLDNELVSERFSAATEAELPKALDAARDWAESRPHIDEARKRAFLSQLDKLAEAGEACGIDIAPLRSIFEEYASNLLPAPTVAEAAE